MNYLDLEKRKELDLEVVIQKDFQCLHMEKMEEKEELGMD